jgi:DNA-binding SARP family transcriptional activator
VRERIQADMARARLVVDPEVIKPADHFIATIGDAVRLESANVDVDLDRFFEHAQTGLDLWKRVRNEAARRDLERAEASYAGDFLEEDLYEDWAASVRDEARALYTAVAGALAELADATHDDEAAIRYRLRISSATLTTRAHTWERSRRCSASVATARRIAHTATTSRA